VRENGARGSTSEALKNEALSKAGKVIGMATSSALVTAQINSSKAPPRSARRLASAASSWPKAMTSDVIR